MHGSRAGLRNDGEDDKDGKMIEKKGESEICE